LRGLVLTVAFAAASIGAVAGVAAVGPPNLSHGPSSIIKPEQM
jgi:hypothetical protein